ncbi:MAG: hypothetical protein J6Y02_17520, partial [Pseudobutyrivibrio sp.]|nr:hypothetical protein [Pseudobutyrivibrio sp.]
ADVSKGGRSTKIYNHLQVKKGKEYADRVEKKVQDTAVKELVGSTLVLAGLAAYDIYRVSN